MRSTLNLLLVCSLVATFAGCSDNNDEAPEGAVNATVYGEAFIEEGIPAEEMADGWAVTFESFVVDVEDIAVGGVTLPSADNVEISEGTNGQGQVISTAAVPEGSYEGSSFDITRVALRGAATKDGVTKTFDWAFDQTVRYTACETTTEVTGDADPSTFQITVHADHYFYDSLVAEEPNVVFQALADADADGDDVITRAELESAGIGGYDAGNAEVDNLWTWLEAQNATLGHVDGEGHCDSQIIPN